MSYPLLLNESERLKELQLLNILDTESEQNFDDLVQLAAQICEVPIAAVSLIDADRQWFKAKFGTSVNETPRALAFCSHTILGDELLIVPNLSEDARFAENPLVMGDAHIRFYAGAPLVMESGNALGTLCVIDAVPRELRPDQQEALRALARQTMELLNLRQQATELLAAKEELKSDAEERARIEEILRLRDQSVTPVREGTLITEPTLHGEVIVYADASFEQLTGYTFEEIRGRDYSFLEGSGTDPAAVAVIRNAVREQKFCLVEILTYRKDGTHFWNEMSISPVKDASGKVTHFVSVQHDITARRQTEEKLRASEESYRFLSESVPQQVWTAQPDGQLDYANQRAIEYFGLKGMREGLGFAWHEFIHPADRFRFVRKWIQSLRTGEHFEIEYRLQRACDGEYRWHLAQASAMRDESGEAIIKWFGTNTDIHNRRVAEENIRKSKEYENLFQHANDAILIFEPENETVLEVNDKACEIYGRTREEFVGRSLKEMSQNTRRGTEELKKLLQDGVYKEFETVHLRGDGSPLNLVINAAVIKYNEKPAILTINRDVTARLIIEDALREREEHFRLLVEGVEDYAIFMLDPEGAVVSWNAGAERLKGYSAEEIIGQHFSCFYPAEERAGNHSEKLQIAARTGRYEEEGWRIRKDGSQFIASDLLTALKDESGRLRGFSKITHDITIRKQAEEKLRHNAFHDELTGLPNRALFLEHLLRAVECCGKRGQKPFAVLFLDFDHFKIINDSLGHLEGDNLLRLVAGRLTDCLRPGDIVARLGGDEFTILLTDLDEPGNIVLIVERIQTALKGPFNLNGSEVFTTASIGIALGDSNYVKPEDILRDADIAMYHAKANGKAQYQMFNQAMHEQANYRLQLETDLRYALRREEFRLYFQPIINLQADKIIGFESLVRWQHPSLGMIPPNEFISIAEETGLIIPLGLWVLHESCRRLREWQTEHEAVPALTMSVNLSCRQFLQHDLVEQVLGIMNETAISPGSLRLEITESCLMEDSEKAISIMKRLRAAGIRLSIDDFGTGYSSLSYLHRLPVDYLKIDRSFVSQMQNNAENREIVRTIVMLARDLKLEVIAEGVETIEQVDYLKSLHCAFGQGYFYARPVDAWQARSLITKDFSNAVAETGKNPVFFELLTHLAQKDIARKGYLKANSQRF